MNSIEIEFLRIGASGCGKSTTIQLIERFYDANVGQLVRENTLIFILSIICFLIVRRFERCA